MMDNIINKEQKINHRKEVIDDVDNAIIENFFNMAFKEGKVPERCFGIELGELDFSPALMKTLVSYDYILKNKTRIKSNTRYNHVHNIAKFFRETKIRNLNEITPELLVNYISMHRRNYQLIFSIKHLLRYAEMIDVFEKFKLKFDSSIKQLPRVKKNKCFSESQLKRLFNELEKIKKHPYYLIFKIQFETVSRISEILDIRLSDISYSEKHKRYKINIRVRKTDIGSREPNYETKASFITSKTSELLGEYLKNNNFENDNPIFSESRFYCDKIIKDISKKWYSNSKKWFSTHWFRHTAITRIIGKTGNIAYAKELAGQKRIETTMKYYNQSGLTSLNIVKDVFE